MYSQVSDDEILSTISEVRSPTRTQHEPSVGSLPGSCAWSLGLEASQPPESLEAVPSLTLARCGLHVPPPQVHAHKDTAGYVLDPHSAIGARPLTLSH